MKTPTTAERIAEKIADEFMDYLPPKRRYVRNIVGSIALDIIRTELERERQQVRDTLDRIYRTALISNAQNPVSRDWLIRETKAALAMLQSQWPCAAPHHANLNPTQRQQVRDLLFRSLNTFRSMQKAGLLAAGEPKLADEIESALAMLEPSREGR